MMVLYIRDISIYIIFLNINFIIHFENEKCDYCCNYGGIDGVIKYFQIREIITREIEYFKVLC